MQFTIILSRRGIPILGLLLLFLVVPTQAQTVSIPGFSGITFQKNGSDEQVSITENFTAFGIEFAPDGLTLGYRVSGEEFYMFGAASFSTENETVEVSFGSESSPGLLIRGTTVEHFELDINSDITLGNLTVETKDLDIQYYNAYQRFYIDGTLIIKEVFELEADLGSATERGIEVDVSGSHPRFKIDNLTIKIENLHGGSVDLNDFELSFNQYGITDSKVDVSFGNGQEVGADITFDENPLRINSIDIFYRADNLSEGLEIFEGVQIAYMDAKVTNLDYPHDLKISGAIQTYYGEGLTIGSESATFFETGADVTISASEFLLSANGNLGAIRSGDSNTWENELGSGSMDLGVYFTKKRVHFSFDTWYPGGDAGIINFDGGVSFSLHELEAYARVDFDIPKKIPYVGGETLGSVEGYFDYTNNLTTRYWTWRGYTTKTINGGVFDAWVDVKIGGVYIAGVGASVDIPSGHVDILGTKIVKNFEENFPGKQASDGANLPNQFVHTFQVDQNPPSSIVFETNWHQIADSAEITVLGPEGYYEVHRIMPTGSDDENGVPTFDLNSNETLVTNDSSAYFLVTTPTRLGQNHIIQPSMVDGRYTVLLTFKNVIPDSSTIQMYQYWQKPEIELEVTKNENENLYEIDYDFWASQTDSAKIVLFAAEKNVIGNTYSKPIHSFSTSDPEENIEVDVNNFGSGTFVYTPDFISDSDSLYFYAVIDDRVNSRVHSQITTPFHHKGDFHGTISFPEAADSLKAGLRLYLDENNDGRFDLESDGGVEPHAISFEDGSFHFINLEEGTYPLRIILPRGYRISGTNDRLSSIDVTYSGSALELPIEIETYTEN